MQYGDRPQRGRSRFDCKESSNSVRVSKVEKMYGVARWMDGYGRTQRRGFAANEAVVKPIE